MRVYGSSGQQRSALLLLDLAAISVYNSWHDDYPLFLIDDVDAELDEKRINVCWSILKVAPRHSLPRRNELTSKRSFREQVCTRLKTAR